MRSTSSSGRSDGGKNWRGTSGIASSDATKQRERDGDGDPAPPHRADEHAAEDAHHRAWLLGGLRLAGFLRSTTPSSGANSTATNHETISAIVTTAKIENVYSPAELRANPIGTKPAAVTKEPVSIGNASVL